MDLQRQRVVQIFVLVSLVSVADKEFISEHLFHFRIRLNVLLMIFKKNSHTYG